MSAHWQFMAIGLGGTILDLMAEKHFPSYVHKFMMSITVDVADSARRYFNSQHGRITAIRVVPQAVTIATIWIRRITRRDKSHVVGSMQQCFPARMSASASVATSRQSFRKLYVSNGKAFFHSFQTCSFIGWSKNVPGDAMMAQEGNKIEMEICTNGMLISKGLSFCSWKCPFDPRVPFAFQPFKPKILANWKLKRPSQWSRLDLDVFVVFCFLYFSLFLRHYS